MEITELDFDFIFVMSVFSFIDTKVHSTIIEHVGIIKTKNGINVSFCDIHLW